MSNVGGGSSGNVGGANFVLHGEADFRQIFEEIKELREELSTTGAVSASNQLERLQKVVNDLRKNLAPGLTGPLESELQDIERVIREIQTLAGGVGPPDVSPAEAKLRSFVKLLDQATQANIDRPFEQLTPQVSRAEEAMRRYVRTINEAGRADLDKPFEELTPQVSSAEERMRRYVRAMDEAARADLDKPFEDLTPKVTSAETAMRRYARAQDEAAQADLDRPFEELTPAVSDAERRMRAYARAQDEAAQKDLDKPFEDLTPKISSAETKMRSFARVQSQAAQADLDEPYRRLTPQISTAESKLRTFVKTQTQAEKEQAKLLRLAGQPIIDPDQVQLANSELKKLEKELRDLEQLRKDRGPAKVVDAAIEEVKADILGLNKALGTVGQDAGFDDIAKEVEKANKPTGIFDRIMGSVNGTLEKFNLNVSSVSVLLGAGFAGGLAGVIKIAIDFGSQIAAVIGASIALERQTRLSFGAAADSIEQFADDSADSLGFTRDELQTTMNAFAAAGRSLNFPEGSLANFSALLAQVSAELEHSLPGFAGLEDVQQTLEEAMKGSQDALRRLGVTFEEEVAKAQALFGKLPSSLTPAEKAIVAIELATDEAAERTEENGRKMVSSWQRVKNAVAGVVDAIGDILTTDQKEAFDFALRAISVLADERVKGAQRDVATRRLKADLIGLSDKQLQQLIDETEKLKISNELKKQIIGVIQQEIDKRNKLDSDRRKHLQTLKEEVDVQRLNEKAFLASSSSMDAARDALKALARAEEDGNLRIREAVINLQRAREDASRRQRDTLKENRRQMEDANERILKAEVNLERARQDKRRKIEDLEFNHRRKLEDFAKREAEVREQAAKDIVTAFRAIEDAQRKDDIVAERAAQNTLNKAIKGGELQDLELDRLREKEDFIRALNELEIEANRQLFDAQRDLQEAFRERQRAFEDAMDRLHDLEVENNRAIADAERNLADAHRDMARSIEDANLQLERMARDLGIVIERIKELLDLAERNKLAPFFGGIPGRIPGLMAGGPFDGPFIAGERGPELVIPGGQGQVVSNNQLVNALREAMGPGGESRIVSPTVNVYEADRDEGELWFAISARLAEEASR